MAERTRRPSPPGAVQRDFEEKTLEERVADLSEDVLESVRDRQQTVIEAMRKFVDRLDEALPDLGEERRKKVLDALVDFADKVGTTPNDFVARKSQLLRARQRQLLRAPQKSQLLRAPQSQLLISRCWLVSTVCAATRPCRT